MTKIHKVKGVFLALLILVTSSQVFGWGQKGHETIEIVAAQLLPDSDFSSLLKRNIDSLRFISMTPDLSWKHGALPHPLEGQAHFFQMDFYSPRGGALFPNISYYLDRAGGDPTILLKKGTAPWRIQQMSWLLVQVLKKPKINPEEVIQIASTLGHYIGDVGNPLHVATDFDGRGVGEKGLHSFFETETVNAMPDRDLILAVNKEASAVIPHIPDNIRPIKGAFNLAQAASLQSEDVLRIAKKSGQTPVSQARFKPIIVHTLALSAAVLAKVWHEAYVVAGSPPLPKRDLGKVPVPPWVPVNYVPGVRAR